MTFKITLTDKPNQNDNNSLSSVKELLDKLWKKELELNPNLDWIIDLDWDWITNQNDVKAFLSWDITLWDNASEIEEEIAKSKDKIELKTIQEKITFLENLLNSIESKNTNSDKEKLLELSVLNKEIEENNKKLSESIDNIFMIYFSKEEIDTIKNDPNLSDKDKNTQINKVKSKLTELFPNLNLSSELERKIGNEVELFYLKNEKYEKQIIKIETVLDKNNKNIKEVKSNLINFNSLYKEYYMKYSTILEKINILTIDYKKIDTDFFLNNIDEIKNIEDKDKLIEVLEEAKKAKRLKDTDNFSNLVHPRYQNNFDILNKFHEIIKRPLNMSDLKNSSIIWNKIYEIFKNNSLKTLFSSNANKIDKFYQPFINGDIINLDLDFLKYSEILSLLDNDSITYFLLKGKSNILIDGLIKFTDSHNPGLCERLKNIKNNINSSIWKDSHKIFNKIKDKTTNIEVKNLSIEEKKSLDNYLSNNINTDTENILSIFSDDINLMNNFPKLLSKIKNNIVLIENTIALIPSFYYTFLATSQQPKYNKIFIESLWYNKKNETDPNYFLRSLSHIYFIETKDFEIFNTVTSEYMIIILLKFKNFRDTFNNFVENNKSYISYFFKKHPDLLKELNKYKDNMQKYETTLTESYNGKDFSKISFKGYTFNENEPLLKWIKNIEKHKDNIQNFINYQLNNKIKESETSMNYMIENWLTTEEFKQILELRNELYEKSLEENNNKLKSYEIKNDSDKKILKLFLTDNTVDPTKIKDSFNLFSKEVWEIKNDKWEKLQKGTSEWIKKVVEMFKKEHWFNKITDKALTELINKSLKWVLQVKINKTQTENSALYFEAVKTWNYDDYYRALENGVDEKINNEINQREKEEQKERLKNTKYPYDMESGKVSITNENWITSEIVLTISEKLLVNSNSEILKNIVDFYIVLEKVGLSKIWSKKESLFKSIWNINWEAFSIDSDYLNENRIKIFLNSILKSVWEDEISPVFTLNSFISKIELQNKVQLWWWQAIVNNYYGETHLENLFFEKFIPRDWTIIDFNTAKFEKSLTEKSNK